MSPRLISPSNRGPRDRGRVLLSPGGDFRRADSTDPYLFRCQHASGICHPDVDWNDRRLCQLHRGAALQSGNSRGGIGAGRRAGLSRRYPDRADAKAVAESRRCGEPRLLTTEPSPDVAPIHDRQMVVLERSDWSAWLEETGNEASLLRALPAGSLKVEQVR